MLEEIWKDVPGYEGYYKVSNLGRVESLRRSVLCKNGAIKPVKGRILKPRLGTTGYYAIYLSKNNNPKVTYIHQLVAIVFLGHTPCRYKRIVDHKNSIRTDNRVDNLRIISARENASYSNRPMKSKLLGAHWSKNENKWKSSIRMNKISIHIGYFNDEQEASDAYMHIRGLMENNKSLEYIKKIVIDNYRV